MPSNYYSAMKIGYGIDIHNNFFTSVRETGKTEDTNISVTALTALYTEILKKTSFEEYANYVGMFVPSMKQSPSNPDYIREQYNVYGDIATKKDEIMLVINKESEASDLLLARLGYYTQDQFTALVEKADEKDYILENYKESFSYEELMSKVFYWYPNSKVFTQSLNPLTPYSYNAYSTSDWAQDQNAVKLKVVGILQPKESVSYGCLDSGVYYTEELTNHILSVSKNEQDGIVDYFNQLDVSSMQLMQMAMASSPSYNLVYTHGGEAFDVKQNVSLAGGTTSIMGMFGGGSSQVTSEDVK